MPAVPLPHSSSTSVSRVQLRRLLDLALPNANDLEAFCLDCVPEVHHQFGSGMERTQKLNLLLASTRPEVLLAHLRAWLHTLDQQKLALTAPLLSPVADSRRWTRRHVLLGAALLGGMLMVVLALGPCAPRNHLAAPSAAATPPDLSVPSYVSTAAVATPWLTSDPAAALVYAVPSGRSLGQTPWSPARSAAISPNGLQVCLRSAGFIPVLVTLESGADQPRPVHVRLQPEPRDAQKRDLEQEPCDVPTPIIE